MSTKDFDIFFNQKVYPNAEEIFSLSLQPIEEIKDNCIVVLDTNALLVPYLTGSESLKVIKQVLEKLKKQRRLIVPGQVAREFASNRPEKLKEIFQQLSRKQNNIQNIGIGKYPLLENIGEYNKISELEKQINEQLSIYRKNISELIKRVKNWNWDDPVSSMYRELFTKEIILDLQIDRDVIKNDLNYRYLHKIPPGFKDEGKLDDGIGDFLIWLTILEIAKKSEDVIFVSSDEKTDWYHRSEKVGLYPRFELISEFKRTSGGNSFHILRLSELLNLFGVDDNVIQEIASEEAFLNIPNQGSYNSVPLTTTEGAVKDWFIGNDYSQIRETKNGFPDFEAVSNKGELIAMEIINFKPSMGIDHFSNLISVILPRLCQLGVQRRYSKIELIFVTHELNFKYEEFEKNILLWKDILETGSISIHYLFGHIDGGGTFIPII